MIRPYQEKDLDELRRITREVFGPGSIDYHLENQFGLIKSKDWRERKVRHIDWDLNAPHGTVFVKEADGAVVGYVTVVLDIEGGIGRMVNLAVAEQAQNQGFAHQLIEHALAYMKDEGMEVAKIETLEGNVKGEHIFPTMGFREVIRQIHFFKKL
jgi:ribosomal protein S18 acetylase RimI-like enzyme